MTILMSCRGEELSQKEIPGKVENPVKESALTTVTLSEKAERRLGIETVSVEYVQMPGVLKLGGEVIAVPGQDVKVAAPVAGTVQHSQNGVSFRAGMRVKKGQEIMRLLIMPPEKDLLSSQEEIAVKEAEYNVALAKFNRSEQLMKDRAISEKAYQEAQAQLAVARGAFNAAKARFQLLNSGSLDTVEGNLSTLVLESPVEGVLQRILVAPGQTVPASTLLFEVSDQDPVWIRIPVYVGDLHKIDSARPALIHPMGETNLGETIPAIPVDGPPLSNAYNATSDVYYQRGNQNGSLRIGQKVMVSIPKKSIRESVGVPFSSIVYDMYGGSWLYAKISPHTFSRKRVEISHVIENVAVLTRGVTVGEEVVVSGAAEIFGTEFGSGK